MIFENLKVRRIVVHEVFQRNDDRTIKAPVFGDVLEELSAEAMGAFRLRLTDALAGQSQSLEMKIVRHGAGSFINMAESTIGVADQDFIELSKGFATRLAEEQRARRIPGGMLIVFEGSVGASSLPFVGAIKAETQAGFRRTRKGPRVIVEFLENIFLTPATRLYKIGMVVFEDRKAAVPDGRRAYVFDSNITPSDREAAAAYYYEGFLGCTFPSDGPYETARFFDLAREFVRKANLAPEKKRDLMDSLFVFVRDEKARTFTAGQFSNSYLPNEMQDSFGEFLSQRKFTPNAVVRDTSQMGNRLRRRKLKFGADIELSASPEALKNRVLIEPIKGTGERSRESWTRITIQETLTGEQ